MKAKRLRQGPGIALSTPKTFRIAMAGKINAELWNELGALSDEHLQVFFVKVCKDFAATPVTTAFIYSRSIKC